MTCPACHKPFPRTALFSWGNNLVCPHCAAEVQLKPWVMVLAMAPLILAPAIKDVFPGMHGTVRILIALGLYFGGWLVVCYLPNVLRTKPQPLSLSILTAPDPNQDSPGTPMRTPGSGPELPGRK